MPKANFFVENKCFFLSILPLLLLGTLLVGCASLPTDTTNPSFQREYGDFAFCPISVVEQTNQSSCGPACLSSVLRYWDKEVSEEELIKKYPNVEGQRYLILELQHIAESEGLKSYVLSMDQKPRAEVEEQILKGRPVICALRLPRHLYLLDRIPLFRTNYRNMTWTLGSRKDHFVVVAGLNPKKVLVMDPAHGFASFSWRRFERAWARMKHACLLISE